MSHLSILSVYKRVCFNFRCCFFYKDNGTQITVKCSLLTETDVKGEFNWTHIQHAIFINNSYIVLFNIPRYWAMSVLMRTNNKGGSLRIGGVQYIYTSFNTSSSHDNMSSSSASVAPFLAKKLNHSRKCIY